MANYIPTSEIEYVKFYVIDENDNERESTVEVKNKELFRQGKPFQNGIYDNRLGTTANEYLCGSCFLSKNECPGHVGKINLQYPVLSPIFKKEVLKWLKVICFKCGECIIKIKNKNVEKAQLLNEYVKLSRTSTQKFTNCPFCGELHPIVQKDPKDHLKIYIKTPEEERRIYNNEIEAIFDKIKPETVIQLGKELDSHPRKFVLNTIRVPPVTIRPDIKKIRGSKSNNNDLTTILKNILTLLEKLPDVLDEELIKKNIIHLDNIEMHYYTLIRETPAGNNNKLQGNTGSSLVSITSRFSKKTGRIRKNILGKRTTYMARSVITPDNIKPGEVGVPISILMNLVKPEIVQYYNKERLMIHFMNKDTQYPGCTKIIKKNGSEYYVGAINDNFVLEEGDTIFRHLVAGDMLAMNRAPSLTNSSISGHVIVPMESGDTFRFSVNIVNSFYSGDFDGDAMSGILPHSISATNECKYLAGIPRWSISLKDGSPSVGLYHDGLIGAFEFTKNGIVINKFNTMKLLSTNDYVYSTFNINKDKYTSHELISKLLPPINYIKKAGFYKPEYCDYIDYDLNDIKVEINRGEYKSGRFDKKSSGEKVDGSIFHVLYNEYGSELALNTIFNIQQMTHLFLMCKGATLTKDDITISKDALKKVHEQTEAILFESKQITENLLNGRIIPPLGMTTNEYFEQQQLSVLNLGDDFLKPVFEDIKLEDNNLFKMVISGSKGKLTNLLQISSSIGQASIGGERIKKLFDFERTCPYYPRFDESPQNRGFVTESYTTGVDMVSFIFQSMEARYSIINKALSTSITGEQNRKSIKNMESLIANNLRLVTADSDVVQFIYGSDGIDNRNNETVKFNTIMIGNLEFEQNYKTTFNDINKLFHNKNIQSILDDEFEQLKADRNLYRTSFINIEKLNTKNNMLDDSKKLPVNVYRIIEDVCFNYKEIISNNTEPLSPEIIYNKIKNLCDDIQYSHFNEFQRKRKMKIPNYIKKALTLIHIAIRTYVNIKNIIKKNIPYHILDIIINRIIFTYKKSLIEYGTPVGIITAQSISEPMTQYVLDSHHRTGSTGTKVDFLGRMKEILGAKDTIKMKAPSMVIYIDDKYKNDEYKVQEIANHIEMMSLKIFIDSYQIFFENYKEIIHPEYIHEMKMIEDFEKHNPLLRIPNDLLKWCIKLDINKEKLIEKNMKFETICFKLYDLYPNLYIVNTAENAKNVFIRIYIRAQQFKKTNVVNVNNIEDFIKSELLNSIIRGIDGIKSSNIDGNVLKTQIDENGSIKKVKQNIITTNGTNLREILTNDYINPYMTKSDSIIEMQEILGVEAARNSIITELMSIMPAADNKYYAVYADRMSTLGFITSIDKSGIDIREKKNLLLGISTSHVLAGLENGAINSIKSQTKTLSPSLMVGKMPKQSSNYNKIIINEKFIKNNVINMESVLDNL